MDQFWSRTLRMAVFALLFVSTLTGLFLSDKLWTLWDAGNLPLWAALTPPVLFFLFMVVFAIDRLHAVRNSSLPAHRAMFHVGASVLFFLLLLPHPTKTSARRLGREPVREDGAIPGTTDEDAAQAAQFLLHIDNEAVRRATCLLLGQTLQDGCRPSDAQLVQLMTDRAQNDRSQAVQEACRQALAELSDGVGSDGMLSWPRTPLFGGPTPNDSELECPRDKDLPDCDEDRAQELDPDGGPVAL